MTDPMDDLVKLRDAIDRVAAELHLKRESWGIVPAEDGMPDHVIVTFSIDPDIVLSDQERQQREVDARFAAITGSIDGPREDPEIASIRDQAKKMLEEDDWEEL